MNNKEIDDPSPIQPISINYFIIIYCKEWSAIRFERIELIGAFTFYLTETLNYSNWKNYNHLPIPLHRLLVDAPDLVGQRLRLHYSHPLAVREDLHNKILGDKHL